MIKNNKIKIAILMGGKSSEYLVSIASGKQVIMALDRDKFEIFPVIISKDGKQWITVEPEIFNSVEVDLTVQGSEVGMENAVRINGIAGIERMGVDVAFIAMHGRYGEDGSIQGMLELFGIPHTGSGVLASALGMDKYRFGVLIGAKGVMRPRSRLENIGCNVICLAKKLGGFPLIVKPNDQGSSVGVRLVNTMNDLESAVKEAMVFGESVLIEEYIKGTEVTCAVIGNNAPIALPVVEIVPRNNFFDYESKYISDITEEIVPARISEQLTKQIQKIALKVYKIVGAKGFARIDFILKDNKVYCLEINTIPGLTDVSLFPRAAMAGGINYSQLIEKIIYLALGEE